MAESYPKVAVGIDGHSVGRAFESMGSGVHGNGCVIYITAVPVVVIGTNLLGWCVDVVKLCGVETPANAVRICDFVDLQMERRARL